MQSLDSILSRIRSGDPHEGREAVADLQDHPDQRTLIPHLIELVKVRRPFDRDVPLEALLMLEAKEAFPAILNALRSGQWGWGYELQAIDAFVDEQNIPIVIDALTEALGNTTGTTTRYAVLKQFIKLGQHFLPALHQSLDDPRWLVRRTIVRALGQIGHPSSVPLILERCIDDDPLVRWGAVEALCQKPIPVPESLVQKLASDSDPHVRRAAQGLVTQR